MEKRFKNNTFFGIVCIVFGSFIANTFRYMVKIWNREIFLKNCLSYIIPNFDRIKGKKQTNWKHISRIDYKSPEKVAIVAECIFSNKPF